MGICCADHFYSKGMDNTQDSEITQYLTEEHCAAAAALGLTVSLHMVVLRNFALEFSSRIWPTFIKTLTRI